MNKLGRIVGVVVAVACVGSFAMGEDAAEQAGEAAKAKPAKCRAGGKGMFTALDADKDGGISLEEFKTGHAKRIAACKARMGDKWSEEKAAKMPTAEAIFKRIDTDESGILSAEEVGKCKRGGSCKTRGACKKAATTDKAAAAPKAGSCKSSSGKCACKAAPAAAE